MIASARASANLSATAQRYLERIGASVEDLFHHTSPPCSIPKPPSGVTQAPLCPEIEAVAVTASWGHYGQQGDALMPGQGRAFTPEERVAMGGAPLAITSGGPRV